MSWTSASLPIATVDTVILSFAIRRSSPWKSPRVICPSERKITCLSSAGRSNSTWYDSFSAGYPSVPPPALMVAIA